MRKTKEILKWLRFKIQGTYMFIFIFSMIGIVGNIKLGVETPKSCIIVCVVSGLLTFGKIFYCMHNNK